MQCPVCHNHSVKVERPGTVIWDARIKKIGYVHRCNNCTFEGKPHRFRFISGIFFRMALENIYTGHPKAVW